MERRDALLLLITSAAGATLASCEMSKEGGISQQQLVALVRNVAGLDTQAKDAPKVLASFNSNRFTAKVDPTIQPQADFDPETDV